jgi:N-acyl-phosphatidylethanolamine-hydrolysing phospholipase D
MSAMPNASTDTPSPLSPPGTGRRFSLRRWAPIGLLALVGCGTSNPYFDARQPHHRPEGFQNLHTPFQDKGLGELLRWWWEARRDGLPAPAQQPVPTVAADLAFITHNARAGAAMQPAFTWVGHSTVLAQFSGLNVLTDPMFSERASPVSFAGPKRAQPPGLSLQQLPHIDLVLVSHDHYDHLDEASVLALNAQAGGPPLFVVPLGLKPWLAERGITHAVELDWWQSHRLGTVDVVLTPAQHWSGRGLTDRRRSLWGGFAVFAPDFHFLYTGDTGYSPDFAEIRRRFADRQKDGGFDLALVPVGAYEPRWFMKDQHVNPEESVRIHRDLGTRRSLGVHWGTFELTDESLDEPPRALARALSAQGLSDNDFFVLAVGQTRQLPRRCEPCAPGGHSPDPATNSTPRSP